MNKIQEVVHKFRSGVSDKKIGDREKNQPLQTRLSSLVMSSSSIVPGGVSRFSSGTVLHKQTSPPFMMSSHGGGGECSDVSSSSQLSTELSFFPMFAQSGLRQTTLDALQRPVRMMFGDSSDRVDDEVWAIGSKLDSPAKKLISHRPMGTFEYQVERTDTIERIAAKCDVTPSTLMKLNRMTSRMVFENQILYLPEVDSVAEQSTMTEKCSTPNQNFSNTRSTFDIPVVRMAETSARTDPGRAETLASDGVADGKTCLPHQLSEDEARKLDEECHERFIKLGAQFIVDDKEMMSGILLVTPNAIMFDPDCLHGDASEGQPGKYGVVLYIDTIISAALYHDINVLRQQSSDRFRDGGHETSETRYNEVGTTCPPTAYVSTCRDVSSAAELGELLSDEGQVSEVIKGEPDESVTDSPDISTLVIGPGDGRSISSHPGAMQSAEASVHCDDDDNIPDVTFSDAHHVASADLCETSDVRLDEEVGRPVAFLRDDNWLPYGTVGGAERWADSVAVSDNYHKREGGNLSSSSGDGSHGNNVVDDVSLIGRHASALVSAVFSSVLRREVGTSHPRNIPDSVDAATCDAAVSETCVGGGHCGIVSQSDDDSFSIGSIVYLPVHDSDSGEVGGVGGADDVHTTTISSSAPRLSPLTGVTRDLPAVPSVSDRGRMRLSSDSIGPLRSPAQHLTGLVNHTTGLFHGVGAGENSEAKDLCDELFQFDLGPHSATETDSADDFVRVTAEVGQDPIMGCRGRDDRGVTVYEKRTTSHDSSPSLFVRRPVGTGATDTAMGLTDQEPSEGSTTAADVLYLMLQVDAAECEQRRDAESAESRCHDAPGMKSQYCFSVPRDKADHLYAFFLQWRPEKYTAGTVCSAEDMGFVVLRTDDVTTEDACCLPFFEDHFSLHGDAFRTDWKIVRRDEARRRVPSSVDQVVMPDLMQDSSILTHKHISELAVSLPTITLGYPWQLLYSTSLHGFSLKRLYRECVAVEGPVLLAFRDSHNTVFGAFLSDTPRRSDHFYGTGICQLWTFKERLKSFNWTGDNEFFIKGDENCLAIGASHGANGLWLDNDLYRGRSQSCTTFGNIALSTTEDFCISALEVWTFVPTSD